MDIVTHILFGNLIRSASGVRDKVTSISILSATIIPDFGELKIQSALANKFGTRFAVYDIRTSDVAVANDISVTWFYDLLHSISLPVVLGLIGWKIWKSKSLIFFSIGLFSHVLLDCATHGKVWALKLFFPISNVRFKIFSESLGNWWNWKPAILFSHFDFQIPYVCVIIWIVIFSLTLIPEIIRLSHKNAQLNILKQSHKR